MGEQLKKSPLVEAICQFNFQSSSREDSWDWTLPGRFYEAIKDEFSNYSQVDRLTVQLTDANPMVVSSPDTIEFQHSSQPWRIVLSANQLAIVHQTPYASWLAFESLISRVFSKYVDIYSSWALSRIALRYINYISPTSKPGKIKIEDYLIVFPGLAEFGDRNVVGFKQNYQIEHSDIRGILIHETGTGQISQKDEIGLILDLSFVSSQIQELNQLDLIQQWLDSAHDRISAAFVTSLNPDYYQSLKSGA